MKYRLKVNDIEAEASTMEDLEELLELAKNFKEGKQANSKKDN